MAKIFNNLMLFVSKLLDKFSDFDKEFENFDNVLAKTILFQSDQQQEVSIRVVVGQIERNFENDGEILIGSEPISKQFRLKIGKK